MTTGMENTLADMQGTPFKTIDGYVSWLKYVKETLLDTLAEQETQIDFLKETVRDEMHLLNSLVADMEKYLSKQDWMLLIELVGTLKHLIAMRADERFGLEIDFNIEEE